MPEWTRDTPWRQGHLLASESVAALGLIHPTHPGDTVVIVATHHCDLTQLPDREPHVEVIVGYRIQKLNGLNTHAKSPRTLHLEFEGNKPLLAEFVSAEKRSILKESLIDFTPDNDSRLSPSELVTFQLWLASRYRRSAFPNEFERRLSAAKLSDKIAKAVKPHGKMITAVFFDVDEGQEICHEGLDDVYVLDVTLLHTTEPDFYAAEAAANQAQAEIEQAFRARLFNAETGNWQGIELRYVDVISEEAMSYRQSKALKKWRLDHISLGADPQQPVLAE
ncbi:MAG: hypothetical protein HZA20_07540 [Nitrospirae bacterium]|nr:hypothetical protein [Nitrospirota bacterium]